jgi:peptidyl-prolyl cis-trans isomerase SurA
LKRLIGFTLFVILAAFAGSGLAAERLDGIAAVVNDDVVLQSDVEEQLALIIMRFQGQVDSTMVDTLRNQILNQLIDEKLIVAEGKRLGITVTDAEVNKEMERAIQGIKERFGGDEGFHRQLAKENTTEEKLRAKLRDDVRQQLVRDKLVQRQIPKKNVSSTEAEAYFKAHKDKFPKVPPELKLAVIQIPATADSVTEAKAKSQALAIRKRIVGGEKFAKVAGETSQDPATAKNGGDLGFVNRGLLDGPLEDAVFALKINDLSQPIRSSAGWHLVEVLDRDTLKARGGRDSLDATGKPALELHVRHILVRVPLEEKDAERARKLADNVRAQAVKGVEFGELVKRYSKYEGPAGPDGDLGFISLGTLQPHIRSGLDTVRVGGVSEVLVNTSGFNIFKVTDRKAEREYEIDEIRQELPDAVAELKQRESYDAWMKTLRGKAHIEIRKG